MNSFRHSSRGSALLVSLIILILVTIVTTVFLERIWGSSQTVQGIEASNAAYYQAVGIIEEELIQSNVSKKTPWEVRNRSGLGYQYAYTGKTLQVRTGSTIMPQAGYGNSPYSKEYNIISLGQPVQIVIPNGLNWNNVSFEFRVPQIGAATTALSTPSGSGIILWTMGYTGASLYASGESQIFRGQDINTLATGSLAGKNGNTNSGSNIQFVDFYNIAQYLGGTLGNGYNCTNYACTLKLSMIRPVTTTGNVTLPFLEYRINFGGTVVVPAQFTTLEATAYSYGFQRTRTLRIPQITTNTALDFAVLQ